MSSQELLERERVRVEVILAGEWITGLTDSKPKSMCRHEPSTEPAHSTYSITDRDWPYHQDVWRSTAGIQVLTKDSQKAAGIHGVCHLIS